MKRFLAMILVIVMVVFSSCASEADKVNHNLSKQADSFDCTRRITVYNARTDTIILEIEGLMALANNGSNELVVTCKVGENTYKKNYVYLNDYVLYVMEDISGTYTDPYHYKMYFHTNILPSIEVEP